MDSLPSSARPDRVQRGALVLSLCLLIAALATQTGEIAKLWNRSQHDLRAYMVAAHNLVGGYEIYKECHRPIPEDPSLKSTDAPWYVYPPLFAMLFAPSALVSFDTFKHIWFIANLLFVLHGLFLLVSALPWQKFKWPAYCALAGLVLCSDALRWLLRTAQADGFVFYLVALGFYLFEKRRMAASAAVLAVATWCKLTTPALVLVYLLVRGNRRFAYASAIAVFGLALVQLAIVRGQLGYFFWTVLPEITNWTHAAPSAQSLWSLADLAGKALGQESFPGILLWALRAIVIAALAVVLSRTAETPARRIYGVAACCMAAALLPNLTWIMAFISAIAGLVAAAYAIFEQKRKWLVWPMASAMALLYSSAWLTDLLPRHLKGLATLAHGRTGFAALLGLSLLATLCLLGGSWCTPLARFKRRAP